MDKTESPVKVKKHRRKKIMAKIFDKISGAIKEYATLPQREKRLRK